MPKKPLLSEKPQKQPKLPCSNYTPDKKTFSKKALLIWHVFLELAAVAGFFALLYPRITVSTSSSLNPSDPFSTPFIVHNDSLLPIYDVTFKTWLTNVEASASHTGVKNGWTEWSDSPIPQINGNQSQTTFCMMKFAWPSPVTDADISVEVHYRSIWIPIKQMRSFRFKTLKGPDNNLYWYPVAVDTKRPNAPSE